MIQITAVVVVVVAEVSARARSVPMHGFQFTTTRFVFCFFEFRNPFAAAGAILNTRTTASNLGMSRSGSFSPPPL